MNHWMVKQEPEAYSWSNLLSDGQTSWTGVRNFLARNHLRTMRRNDLVLFYHSVSEKQVVGVAHVVREAYPDPTASEGDWACVDLAPSFSLEQPVSLAVMKVDPVLQHLPLIRQSRLSVLPVSKEQFARLLEVAKTPQPKAS